LLKIGEIEPVIGEQDRLMRHWKTTLPHPVLTLRLDDWVKDFDATRWRARWPLSMCRGTPPARASTRPTAPCTGLPHPGEATRQRTRLGSVAGLRRGARAIDEELERTSALEEGREG
jgi:hypothetical protein